MAKSKKPQNETTDEAAARKKLERVANTANRSDKVSWNRKMDNMIKLVSEINQIQEQILDLEEAKMPIFDEIQTLRQTMVAECVHPYNFLVELDDGVVFCKFCEKKIAPINGSTKG